MAALNRLASSSGQANPFFLSIPFVPPASQGPLHSSLVTPSPQSLHWDGDGEEGGSAPFWFRKLSQMFLLLVLPRSPVQDITVMCVPVVRTSSWLGPTVVKLVIFPCPFYVLQKLMFSGYLLTLMRKVCSTWLMPLEAVNFLSNHVSTS